MCGNIPKFKASHVLIDIDITFVGLPCGGSVPNEGYLEAFRRVWHENKPDAEYQGIPEDKCMFVFAKEQGLPIKPLWDLVISYHMSLGLFVHPDAIDLLGKLKKRGLTVCTATTNPRMVALSKIAVDGFADMQSSPYLDLYFGGDIVPGGKSSGRFYDEIIKRLGIPPSDILMIGDDPTPDAMYPSEAGISQKILIDRNSQVEWQHGPYGSIIVNNLAIVDEWLMPIL